MTVLSVGKSWYQKQQLWGRRQEVAAHDWPIWNWRVFLGKALCFNYILFALLYLQIVQLAQMVEGPAYESNILGSISGLCFYYFINNFLQIQCVTIMCAHHALQTLAIGSIQPPDPAYIKSCTWWTLRQEPHWITHKEHGPTNMGLSKFFSTPPGLLSHQAQSNISF